MRSVALHVFGGVYLMRRFLILGAGLVAGFLGPPSSTDATVIKGRIVDSVGQPVAGAEIRIWRKTQPVGAVRNQPVSFGKEEMLRADDDGRFATPDLFDNAARVRLVAQAEGLMAGRSTWLIPQGEVAEINDIVLVRLHGIIGRVVDGRGDPVADATVFNRDGHEQVETKTGRNGKFLLDGVPAAAQAGMRLRRSMFVS
jgi:hypothetical protein